LNEYNDLQIDESALFEKSNAIDEYIEELYKNIDVDRIKANNNLRVALDLLETGDDNELHVLVLEELALLQCGLAWSAIARRGDQTFAQGVQGCLVAVA